MCSNVAAMGAKHVDKLDGRKQIKFKKRGSTKTKVTAIRQDLARLLKVTSVNAES